MCINLTFWTNLAYLTLCITITTVAAMALLMFNCVLHMFFMWNNSTDIMADSSLPDTAVLWLTPHVLCRYCVKSEVWDKWPELLKSVHFKNTVARSSVLSKLWSFSIIHQLTLFWFQLMLYWKFLKEPRQLCSKNERTLRSSIFQKL